jgi:hypothetical protein
MATPTAEPLKPSSLTWHIDRAFWFSLSSLKLEKWKLDASPQPCTAFYSTAVRASDHGGVLELAAGAFEHDMYFPQARRLARLVPVILFALLFRC